MARCHASPLQGHLHRCRTGCSVFFAPHWESQNILTLPSLGSKLLRGPHPSPWTPPSSLPLSLLLADLSTLSALPQTRLGHHAGNICFHKKGDRLVKAEGLISHREELGFYFK